MALDSLRVRYAEEEVECCHLSCPGETHGRAHLVQRPLVSQHRHVVQVTCLQLLQKPVVSANIKLVLETFSLFKNKPHHGIL